MIRSFLLTSLTSAVVHTIAISGMTFGVPISLSVDFGVSDSTVGTTPNDVQAGFQDFTHPYTIALSFEDRGDTFGAVQHTFGAFTVKVNQGGGSGSPVRAADRVASGVDDITHPLGDLLEEYVSMSGGTVPVVITISGLAPGNYSMTTYHHDLSPSTAQATLKLSVDTGGGAVDVATGIVASTGTTPTSVTTATFPFSIAGTAVDVLMTKTGGASFAVPLMNGFVLTELPIPEPGVAWMVLPAVAFFAKRHRR